MTKLNQLSFFLLVSRLPLLSCKQPDATVINDPTIRAGTAMFKGTIITASRVYTNYDEDAYCLNANREMVVKEILKADR